MAVLADFVVAFFVLVFPAARDVAVLVAATRDDVFTRCAFVVGVFTFVVSRGFTVCGAVVVRDTTRCCGFTAVLAFLVAFCVLLCLFADVVAVARPEEVVAETVAVLRFDAARTVSDVSANVVWDTDKPRHTAKNSIILFIP